MTATETTPSASMLDEYAADGVDEHTVWLEVWDQLQAAQDKAERWQQIHERHKNRIGAALQAALSDMKSESEGDAQRAVLECIAMCDTKVARFEHGVSGVESDQFETDPSLDTSVITAASASWAVDSASGSLAAAERRALTESLSRLRIEKEAIEQSARRLRQQADAAVASRAELEAENIELRARIVAEALSPRAFGGKVISTPKRSAVSSSVRYLGDDNDIDNARGTFGGRQNANNTCTSPAGSGTSAVRSRSRSHSPVKSRGGGSPAGSGIAVVRSQSPTKSRSSTPQGSGVAAAVLLRPTSPPTNNAGSFVSPVRQGSSPVSLPSTLPSPQRRHMDTAVAVAVVSSASRKSLGDSPLSPRSPGTRAPVAVARVEGDLSFMANEVEKLKLKCEELSNERDIAVREQESALAEVVRVEGEMRELDAKVAKVDIEKLELEEKVASLVAESEINTLEAEMSSKQALHLTKSLAAVTASAAALSDEVAARRRQSDENGDGDGVGGGTSQSRVCGVCVAHACEASAVSLHDRLSEELETLVTVQETRRAAAIAGENAVNRGCENVKKVESRRKALQRELLDLLQDASEGTGPDRPENSAVSSPRTLVSMSARSTVRTITHGENNRQSTTLDSIRSSSVDISRFRRVVVSLVGACDKEAASHHNVTNLTDRSAFLRGLHQSGQEAIDFMSAQMTLVASARSNKHGPRNDNDTAVGHADKSVWQDAGMNASKVTYNGSSDDDQGDDAHLPMDLPISVPVPVPVDVLSTNTSDNGGDGPLKDNVDAASNERRVEHLQAQLKAMEKAHGMVLSEAARLRLQVETLTQQFDRQHSLLKRSRMPESPVPGTHRDRSEFDVSFDGDASSVGRTESCDGNNAGTAKNNNSTSLDDTPTYTPTYTATASVNGPSPSPSPTRAAPAHGRRAVAELRGPPVVNTHVTALETENLRLVDVESRLRGEILELSRRYERQTEMFKAQLTGHNLANEFSSFSRQGDDSSYLEMWPPPSQQSQQNLANDVMSSVTVSSVVPSHSLTRNDDDSEGDVDVDSDIDSQGSDQDNGPDSPFAYEESYGVMDSGDPDYESDSRIVIAVTPSRQHPERIPEEAPLDVSHSSLRSPLPPRRTDDLSHGFWKHSSSNNASPRRVLNLDRDNDNNDDNSGVNGAGDAAATNAAAASQGHGRDGDCSEQSSVAPMTPQELVEMGIGVML